MKKRLDRLLVDKGLAESLSNAQALILAGQVFVNDQRVDKAGQCVAIDAPLRLKESLKYVSRGGLKLEGALNYFQIDVAEKICIDVGASTGGFTDCLLQQGAKRVYAVDVGYGQFDWKLRQNPKVVVLEKQNIRHLPLELIPEPVDLVAVDVSFISLELIFPAIKKFLVPNATVIALIKPQFEVEAKKVGPKGVVKDPLLHQETIDKIKAAGSREGWEPAGVTPSSILGVKGNQEFLILFKTM